ncbi:U2 small nuclear ribonucleoprotein auxiliary factor 35 kDa subunit-related protein 1-like [Patiria miniata]|uniref:C3H1-type domain-containing protein n=1 Tax=Patiria miniata TaxID=46514 RepID=A0A913ZGC4_PATMI|nr:U2 small nuclear ribonucleoprotein auxiliary factor 35 kDa subunit-related protein 1-like [Patiria miniata]
MDVETESCAPKKLSHKQYKALLKREKRRCQRQAAAQLQAELEARNAPPSEDPTVEETARLVKIEQEQEKKDEEERRVAHEAWLEREQLAQEAFEVIKKKEEAQKKKLLEEQRRIQEEWEARQKQEKQTSQSKKERELEDVLQQLDKEIEAGEDKPTHNPEAPRQSQQTKQEPCSFYRKTGGCRFGDRCSRTHIPPEISTSLLFPHMYIDFTLEQSHRDEYDTDMGLEYDEGDAYERFLEFYNDVLPELKEFGTVVQFKVCCNWEPHLRGNVYVQYKREEDSSKARDSFHGRFYAGKQLSCIFTPVTSWKAAICGMFHQNKCSRGKNCNFLHVFQNPNREFANADRDFQTLGSRGGQSQRGWRYDQDRRNRDRSRSREKRREQCRRSHSRDRRHRSRERSRSRERRSRYSSSRSHRSRSRDRSRKKRSRTRSRSRSRSPLRTSRRHRSRSGSRSRRHSPRSPRETSTRSQDRSVHHRSRSRSRHRDSRSPSLPRSSRSRSVSPQKTKSKSKSRNVRSQSRSRDDQQSSSDCDDNIHVRTKHRKKKHKSAKDKGKVEPPDPSHEDVSNQDTNADGVNKCELLDSNYQERSTNGDHHKEAENVNTDQPLIKTEITEELKKNTRLEDSEKQDHASRESTGDDSGGELEESKSLDIKRSRSLGKDELTSSHRSSNKKKHKHKHKKRRHKKQRRLSPHSDS